MVSESDEEAGGTTNSAAQVLPQATSGSGLAPPSQGKGATLRMQTVREYYELEGVSLQVTDFLVKSWRDGTQ